MIQLEDLGSFCVSTGYPSGMRPVRLGAGRGALGGQGGAWARAPGVARVLFIGFFFSTRSARGARTKITPILGKNHARVEIIDLKSKSQASARDFAYHAGHHAVVRILYHTLNGVL